MWRNKARQLGLFNTSKVSGKEFIFAGRVIARNICYTKGSVTSDDVRQRFPIPDHLDPSLYGHIFRCTDFRKVGVVTRRLNKGGGGYINKWVINE